MPVPSPKVGFDLLSPSFGVVKQNMAPLQPLWGRSLDIEINLKQYYAFVAQLSS